MKKLTLLLATILTLISCSKKEDDPKPKEVEQTVYAAFGGQLSVNGSVTINGVKKQLNVIYPCKKGDVLRFDDTGVDIIHQPLILYPTGGGSPIVVQAGYTEEGETYGAIIVGESTVAQHDGITIKSDTHLSYTIR